MKDNQVKPSDQFLHPFLFVLKEGQGIGIGSDYLDYSLLLLQVGRPDILRSPKFYPSEIVSTQDS